MSTVSSAKIYADDMHITVASDDINELPQMMKEDNLINPDNLKAQCLEQYCSASGASIDDIACQCETDSSIHQYRIVCVPFCRCLFSC